jgi:carboxypeptidase C (cathepsin A)
MSRRHLQEPAAAVSDPDTAKKLQQACRQAAGAPAAISQGDGYAGRADAPLQYEARGRVHAGDGAGPDGVPANPQAAVLATSYRLQGAVRSTRPVCFAFNGGPGSASIWLHLGALGPKRVVVPDDGSAAARPHAVVDNPLTWLEHFDLVFIDPPHTGWSVSASEAARKRMLSWTATSRHWPR